MQAPVDDEATRLIAPTTSEPRLCLTIRSPAELAEGQSVAARLGATGSLCIGRDERADWLLTDRSGGISREHCLICFSAGAFVLDDKSANGTFVNGSSARLRGTYRLRNGDQLCIGPYLIDVEISGVAVAPAGAANVSSTAHRAPSEPPTAKLPPAPPATIRRGGDPAALVVDTPPSERASAPPTPLAITPASPAPTADGHGNLPATAPSTPPSDEFTRLAPVASQPAVPPAMAGLPAASAGQPGTARAPIPAAAGAGDTSPDATDTAERVRAALARGLGLSLDDLHESDPAVLAEQVGELLRLFTGELRQLLAQRSAALDEPPAVQSAIGGCNPLAIMPSSEEALRILFGPPRRAFLEPHTAYANSLRDLVHYWRASEAAIVTATRVLAGELAPSAIEHAAQADKGLGQLLGARKAKLWETYCERWSKRPALQPERPLASFLRTFAGPALDGAGDPIEKSSADDGSRH
ncbi:MAG: type VI secretion system-associated FHA domain protein TagH [Candidatus Accumulibacter sp.]|uniref:type VI secretion system-associated FHA domain protein TagH n=1 Tax=Accumulibacter sp. TaxID=2053492 RepID=UPI0028792C2C|nr:type VI secretion system-associated FHA domain protein TagH [Accumulibacter sp.]MDS4013848.1 type VI secretion system-associated FHA domain protein TagH [Accumulibacter sp.]